MWFCIFICTFQINKYLSCNSPAGCIDLGLIFGIPLKSIQWHLPSTDAKYYTLCMSAYLLLKYGKIRNESKSIAIFDGPLRYQRNAEYIYACKSWGCQGRSCPDSGCVITIFNWKQQGVKWKNIHLILHLLRTILCENKPGYARKQKFTKAHKARNTKKN